MIRRANIRIGAEICMNSANFERKVVYAIQYLELLTLLQY